MNKQIIFMVSDKRSIYLDWYNNRILNDDEILFDVANPPEGIIPVLLRKYPIDSIDDLMTNAIDLAESDEELTKIFFINGPLERQKTGKIILYLGVKVV